MIDENWKETDQWFPYLERTRSVAEDVLNELLDVSGRREELTERGMVGGYYCMSPHDTNVPGYIIGVGACPTVEKALGRLEKCIEKTVRLAANPDHATSMESRDPDNGKYGGGVRGVKNNHSFSGLPEELDQIFSCLMAFRANDMAYETAARIIGDDYHKYLWIVHGRQPVK